VVATYSTPSNGLIGSRAVQLSFAPLVRQAARYTAIRGW